MTHAGDVADEDLAAAEPVAVRAVRRRLRDPRAAVRPDEIADCHGGQPMARSDLTYECPAITSGASLDSQRMGEPIPDALNAPSAPRKKNAVGIATLVVAVLILVGVAGILGLDVWRATQPDASGLAGAVQSSMDDYFATRENEDMRGATAGSVLIMRSGVNSFEAQVDVSTAKGVHRSVPVHVMYDGEDMFWNADPGAFLFVVNP